jgi:hypothetical protein
MSKAFVPDLEQARDLQSAIEIITATGQRYVTGVVDIDAEENWVRIRRPQHFGDSDTTSVLLISDIAQVTLHTDMPYE